MGSTIGGTARGSATLGSTSATLGSATGRTLSGMIGTLGSGIKPGGTGTGMLREVKIPANLFKSLHTVLDMGANREAGEGLLSAIVRSLAVVMMASADDMVGILMCIGYQTKVSAILSALVSLIHT